MPKTSPPFQVKKSRLKRWWQNLPEWQRNLKFVLLIIGAFGTVGSAILYTTSLFNIDIGKWRRNYFRCISAEAHMPQVMPLSLAHSLHSKHFPYWLRLKANNSCDHVAYVTVSWTRAQTTSPPQIFVSGKDGGDITKKESTYKVEPNDGKKGGFAKNFNPTIKVGGNSDLFINDAELQVSWNISDNNKEEITKDTELIRVLAPNQFKWDLKDAFEEDVNKDFLLSSLANWVKTKTDKVPEAVTRLSGRDISDADDVGAFMEELYKDLFSNSSQLRYVYGSVVFPPRSEMEIRTPDAVLGGEKSNPLEVALSFVAIAQKAVDRLDVKFVLFMVPNDDKIQGSKRVLVGWSTPGDQWKAIDISSARNKEDFNQNTKHATERLKKVIEKHPKIIKTLYASGNDRGGVYVDEVASIFALDFRRVEKREDLNIRSLPSKR